ncbi:LysR substrate-binding domain-containing protein [Zhongshania arctica]|uniref:LysR substrate-binding domain-containing protein n=1 Tax=Zhongshania arctica TaxID=3238302 RepID=A0ABV3TY66_9GAMM
MKLNLRSVDLNLLTIFDAIMSCGQMSKAATQLHMTQPAASHALKRLRQTFNDELFIRTRQGMKPTARATEIAPAIREVLAKIIDTLDVGNIFEPRESDRIFKIAFGRYGELNLLPQLLNKVQEFDTDIRIHSHTDDQQTGIDLVRDGIIDFCYDFIPPEDKRLDFCPFRNEEIVVIARKNHPRIKTEISLSQFFSEKHIVMTFGNDRRELLEKFMAEQGGKRQILTEVNQYLAVPTVVMQTDGIALVPRGMAEFKLYKDELTILPMPLALPSLPTYLIWHGANNQDKGHHWLKQLILECS